MDIKPTALAQFVTEHKDLTCFYCETMLNSECLLQKYADWMLNPSEKVNFYICSFFFNCWSVLLDFCMLVNGPKMIRQMTFNGEFSFLAIKSRCYTWIPVSDAFVCRTSLPQIKVMRVSKGWLGAPLWLEGGKGEGDTVFCKFPPLLASELREKRAATHLSL